MAYREEFQQGAGALRDGSGRKDRPASAGGAEASGDSAPGQEKGPRQKAGYPGRAGCGAGVRRLRGSRMVDRRPLHGLDRRRLCAGRHRDPVAPRSPAMSPRVAGRRTTRASRPATLIARIDDGDYRLALQSAQDKLATQQSAHRAHRAPDRGRPAPRVAQAEAQIDAAQADADAVPTPITSASSSSPRPTSPARRGSTRRTADRDRAEAAVHERRGRARGRAGQCRGARRRSRPRRERVAAELQTAVDKAERDLAFTVIRAPGRRRRSATRRSQVGDLRAARHAARRARAAATASMSTPTSRRRSSPQLQPGQTVRARGRRASRTRDIDGTVESIAPASGSVFSLLPPENATGNFTKIVQRVPVRIDVPSRRARSRAAAPRPVGRRRRRHAARRRRADDWPRSRSRRHGRTAAITARSARHAGRAIRAASTGAGSSPSSAWCSACSWRSWTSRSSRPRSPRSRPACRRQRRRDLLGADQPT